MHSPGQKAGNKGFNLLSLLMMVAFMIAAAVALAVFIPGNGYGVGT